MKYLILLLAFISAPLLAAQGNMDSKYVVYNVDDQTFFEKDGKIRRKSWPVIDGGALGADFPANLRYLEITEGAKPAFDPALEYLVPGRVVDLPNTEWRREWTVTAYTQAELDEIAAEAADEAERDQAKAIYQELKNVGNADLNSDAKIREHIIKLSRVVARLLRDNYGE